MKLLFEDAIAVADECAEIIRFADRLWSAGCRTADDARRFCARNRRLKIAGFNTLPRA